MNGLREAHAHIAQLGHSMSFVDLEGCGSGEELLDRMRSRAKTEPPGVWIIGQGARPEGWDDPRWPTLNAFDEAVGGRPAIAWCFDYHALLASSAAMRAAGLPEQTPAGGIVELDNAGNPTGVLKEGAAYAVWSAVPEPGESERRLHVRDALAHLAKLGYIEVHDLKSQTWLGPLLGELDDAGELGLSVRLFPLIDDAGEVHATRAPWERDNVRLSGVKIFTDGTLNSRTAWMLKPYADPDPEHPRGVKVIDEAQIEDAVRFADSLKLPIAAHAIGDGAVRAVLDAIERVNPRTPGHRIEHAELIDERDVPRFAELGVAASVQPCHLLPDIEALRRLVPDRLGRVLPLRGLIDAGCVPGELLIFGSDVPIVRADPADSIRAAIHRRREGMPAKDAIALEQAISEDEAWAAFRSTA